MKFKLLLLLTVVNGILLSGLAYYVWSQKNDHVRLGDRLEQAFNKSKVVVDDLAKLRLDFDQQAASMDAAILKQNSELKSLSRSNLGQLVELDATVSALRSKIEELGRLTNEVGRLDALAKQVKRIEGIVHSLESEVKSSGHFELKIDDPQGFLSRLGELEQASIVLLEHALLQ